MFKKILVSVSTVLFILNVPGYAQTYTGEASNRVKINLGASPWKFLKSDPPLAQNPTLNDGSWKTVGIPYTWGDAESFLNMGAGGPGSGIGAIVWYRKHFSLDNGYKGRKIFVVFEGAHIGAQAYINGSMMKSQSSAENPNATHVIGFEPFVIDISDSVKFDGADNVLAVRVSNVEGFYTYPHFSCEFKYGMGQGGLIWPVNMYICDKVYVPLNVYAIYKNWGTYVAAVDANDASATVRIMTHVMNQGGAAANVTLTTKIVDAATKIVAWTGDLSATVPNDTAGHVFDQTATVASPKLWYPANSPYGKPNMYRVYHIVKVGGTTVDVFESPLGIRVITWNNDCPVINGHPHFLWGGSSRYDYPALGAALPAEVWWRDAKYMADCGGSLWRPGHATISPDFVEACDAYGVMIMQPSGDIEGSFMTSQIAPWQQSYNARLKYETHRDMLVRHRNNPSIVAWEVSNGPIDIDFAKACRHLDSLWDPVHTRASSDRGYWPDVPNVQAGATSIIACSGNGCATPFHQQYPAIPTWGSEEWGAGTAFRFNYDGELAFANGYVNNWRNYYKAHVFGYAQWYTADTPGETGLGRSFGCSMMDFSRFPKMLYKIFQAAWTYYSVKPIVNLAHHANRSGAITVNAFSNCPSVRLRINGTDQGTKTPYPDTVGTAMMPRQCQWNVNFSGGTIRAEGLDAGGNVVCFDEKKTAGNPTQVILTVLPSIIRPDNGDTFKITANGSDAAILQATIADAQGNWCPTSSPNVTFSVVSGPGLYCGGADNNTGGGGGNYHAPFDPELTAEGGMTRIAVRSQFTTGIVTVKATSPGLNDGIATFTVVPVPVPCPVNTIGSLHSASAAIMPTISLGLYGSMIKYCLNTPASVSFEILNAGGRVISRTPISKQSEGWHVLNCWNRKNTGTNGNGIYFVKCTVDGKVFAKKRIVVVR
jgi:beta-galactosidase